jgi:hypothetical protein
MVDIHAYSYVIRKLRQFFQDQKGYIEVPIIHYHKPVKCG